MKENKKECLIRTVCPFCGHAHEVAVNEDDYFSWRFDGGLVQSAFPYLSADEREMLISGICPTCWEKTFANEKEDSKAFSDFYEGGFDLEIGFNPYEGCYDYDC